MPSHDREFTYLDHAATTRVDDVVFDAMTPWQRDEYGNASSSHAPGVRARAALDAARAQVERAVMGPSGKARVFFTGSGTEANFLAIHGFTVRSGDVVIASAVEHPSVRKNCEALAERRGFRFVAAPVSPDGRLDLDALSASLTKDTVLVCLMAVQNELGTIQPILEATRRVRDHAPRAHVHVDAIQALGKIALEPIAATVDSLTISAHKIHGPKGVGALVVRSTRPLKPPMLGGGQENGARSGTENVAGIVGLGVAAEAARRSLEATRTHLLRLRARVVAALRAHEGVRILGPTDEAQVSPAIVGATVAGLRGETLQHELESRGVVLGTGSACHAARGALSPTFEAISLDETTARSMIRVSLSRTTTDADIDAFVAALPPAFLRLADFVG